MTETRTAITIRRAATAQERNGKEFRFLVLASFAHLPLSLALYSLGTAALLHPLSVLAVGLYWAVNRRYSLERVSLAIAYLVGAEILWRMAFVPVPWEFGKIGSAIIAIVALVVRRRYVIPIPPLAYIVLLAPACVFMLMEESLSSARELLSVQMSGPVFLVVACWFFSYVRIDPARLRLLFFAVLVPILSVAFVTLFYTVTAEDIQFTGESNFATSAGFGPNQVSSILGLGVFVAVLLLLVYRNSVRYYGYLVLAAVFMAAQSAMTFSRGGLYNAMGAAIVVGLILFTRPGVAFKRIAPLLIGGVMFLILLFPYMNRFTGGALLERFEDTGTSERTEIAESDLELFLENPVFGVGLGESYDEREAILDRKAMTHTEFSRLFSEHGIFGAGALLSLVFMLVINFRRQRSLFGKAVVAGVAIWSCLFMTNAAMRLAAPSFFLGLTYITLVGRRSVYRVLAPKGDSPAV